MGENNLFETLRRNRLENGSPYSFQGDTRPPPETRSFRDRPGVQTTPPQTHPAPTVGRSPTIIRQERNAEGDRPYAYPVPVQESTDLYEWRPPSTGEVLADLGLRVLEVAIAAAAYAAGEEIAYFFRQRRFGNHRRR